MKAYFQKLFKYNEWANLELMKAVEKVDPPPQEALKFLAHISTAQDLWLARILKTEHPQVDLWPDMGIDEIKEKLPESSEEWSEFIETMNEDHFQEEHQYTNSKGDLYVSTMEDIIIHVINHGTHHRSQISRVLREQGYDPPSTDYIFFTRKKK